MLQVLLLAPIKLPGKVVNVLKYLAVGIGLLQRALEEDKSYAPPPASKVPENSDDLVESIDERRPGNES